MDILDKYKKITNYDLGPFFIDYNDFIDTRMQSIVAYYKGNASVDKSAFEMLNDLVTRANTIEHITSLMSSSLSQTTEFWDLIDNLSTAKTKLETVQNLSKWMRSSYVYGYENQAKRKYILKQNQTLEDLSMELGSDDANQDWTDIATSNSLMELDYTEEGGNVLDVKNTDNRTFNVTSVVDVMVGDNILGKDLAEKITIINDDIEALSTQDTMVQSAGICLEVVRGSVPEFPALGISKQLVGSDVNTLRMSSLVREVNNNFRTDDSFKSVEMTDSRIEGDTAFYDFRIVSRLNNETNKTL
jgi:hypothetical protein